MSKQIILTCEHAGNEIPKLYRDLFHKNKAVLDTHRGYDIGALELIKTCSEKITVTPYIYSVTRLLVDLNRSLHNPELFSEFMESLDTEEREKIVKEYYEPHRNSVQNRISELIWNGDHVLHISVHTFTPHLNGIERG